MGNTENAAGTLCEVLANEVTASEINSKVENAKKQYGDLKKRNESLKNGLENNVKQVTTLSKNICFYNKFWCFILFFLWFTGKRVRSSV